MLSFERGKLNPDLMSKLTSSHCWEVSELKLEEERGPR